MDYFGLIELIGIITLIGLNGLIGLIGLIGLRVSDSKNGAHLTLGVTILYSDLYQLMQNDQKLGEMIIVFI